MESCNSHACHSDDDSSDYVPRSAAFRIRGKLNGEKIEDMYLDAALDQVGPKHMVSASLDDILQSQVCTKSFQRQ